MVYPLRARSFARTMGTWSRDFTLNETLGTLFSGYCGRNTRYENILQLHFTPVHLQVAATNDNQFYDEGLRASVCGSWTRF
jgi:hypothetical protein